MAKYTELRELYNDGPLNNTIQVAVAVAIDEITSRADPLPTNDELVWSDYATGSISGVSKQVLQIVLAKNKDLTVEAIKGAGDGSFQTNVNDIIPGLITAYASRVVGGI